MNQLDQAIVEFQNFLIRALDGGVMTAEDLIQRFEVNRAIVERITFVLLESAKKEAHRRAITGSSPQETFEIAAGQGIFIGILAGHHLTKLGLL
jgi:hypothetical protein